MDCQKKYGAKWKNEIEAYLKERDLISPETNLLFILSPNDLVYLPANENCQVMTTNIDRNRIYKYIDPGMNTGNFVPYSTANVLFSIKYSNQKKMGLSYPIQDEFGVGSQCSKNPRAITGEMIKATGVPIKVDRLGNIIKIG